MSQEINSIKFVNAWVDAVNRSAGVKAVASRLNITVESASAKANNLRSKGVELPAMPMARRDSVEDLNALIQRKLEVK